MKTMTNVQAIRNFPALLGRAGFGGQRIMVTRYGSPLAMIGPVTIKDAAALKRLIEKTESRTAPVKVNSARLAKAKAAAAARIAASAARTTTSNPTTHKEPK